jgi:hypothetical protein
LRRLLLVAALVSVLAAGSAVAVSTDFLREQARVDDRPWSPPALARVGERVEVARGADWSFMAWKAENATCLAYAAGDVTTWLRVCGRAADDLAIGPHGSRYLLTYGAVTQTQGVSDGRGAVFGAVTADVTQVEVELADGRVLRADTKRAGELNTSARFFIVRETLEQLPFPATSLTFLSSSGDTLERFHLGS